MHKKITLFVLLLTKGLLLGVVGGGSSLGLDYKYPWKQTTHTSTKIIHGFILSPSITAMSFASSICCLACT